MLPCQYSQAFIFTITKIYCRKIRQEVSTKLDDYLQAGKPSQYATNHPDQRGLLPSTVHSMVKRVSTIYCTEQEKCQDRLKYEMHD